ncbi:non-ribosomal peptide synthetase, partial [Myxococcus sp. RHSTA-1-4]|uniref:non-ribosomal peptide synthetase n=1 Tax=Myxococcus sp. RHSTA-1-4 TaxID=2874601 RepID=UPI001CC18BC8
LTMHHIVSDGWSMGVLVREMGILYAANATGTEARLPPLPVQYADYAAWQLQWLKDAALKVRLDYWRHQLSGAPALLELPTDRPRPAVQSRRGARQPVVLPADLSESIKALSQRHGVTPFMTLLAAFQTLLYRYSSQDDITVGSPIAGRTRGETEGLIGFFVNTLVLRTHIVSRDSFSSLLARVKETTLGAYEHQDVPFEKLVEELKPERSLSYSPLFQVMFSLQNTPMGALELPGLRLRALELEDIPAKFDLDLSLRETPGGFVGALQYATDLFDAATVARMVEHLRTLLRAATAHPEQPLSALPLMDEAEQHRLLVEWNDTTVEFTDGGCVHDRISAQAARTPDALAAVSDSGSLTYAQLEARSTQLASHLRRLGVRPGSLVALCMERSLELPVALLGILKAGGAYVPLDPAYPRERLAFMLQDTAAPVLVTQQHLRGLLPEGPTVVCLDSGWGSVDGVSEPSIRVAPESAAYVIFTSGSTGQPKGTVISHRALANHMAWLLSTFGISARDRVIQKTPLSFDASVWECWAPLLVGAPLVLAPPEAHRDPAALLACVVRQRVTVLQVVPSMLRFLLEEEYLRRATHLRWLFCGGEALASELGPRLRAVLPEVRLVNLYGPTEVTIDSTSAEASGEESGVTVPIGRPVANTRAYVLDARMQPMPTGIPGELYLGGVQLAQGYLQRPHLTAERFVPDSLSGQAGARLYRTGDKVRWKADGTLEYLGRIDFQVKLRGQRIELGEIEAALKQQPGVRDATVLVREDVPGNQRLVGYVVPAPGQPPESAALRSALLKHLPEYMVPSAFVTLEALPLTPNGKLDRKALPPPDAGATSGGYLAPRMPTENQLAGLMAALLRVERVGVDDSFFALGGHSLLATQLVSRIRATFGVELPLRAVFESPTLAGLAQRITALQGGGAPRHQAPPLRPVPRDRALPLSFAQQRLWFIDQLEPGSAAYNMPTAVRLSGALDIAALERALHALIARHESLRTTFATQDGEAVQLIHAPAQAPLPLVDLSPLPDERREAEARRAFSEEARRPFDLARGPLLRTTLLRLQGSEHVLLLTMHHIVSDGWSTGVLVRELAAMYQAEVSGTSPSLPALPVQYADYAAWQRDWLRGEVLEAWLGYWKRQLSGAPALLELPTDRPRPATQSFRGSFVPVALSRDLSDALLAACQRHGVTPFMLLLAAFQVLLHRYSGQDDIVVGSPIAGRTRSETEGLIGFFVNTLVLRARIAPRGSFLSLLQQVRETTLGAYEHQDVPFEKLVEELRPERSLSYSPLFQVMFSVQNTPAGTLELPELRLRTLELEDVPAKFDLDLGLTETPEGFTGSLQYATDLFDAATAARMVEHLHVLLRAAVAHPELPVSSLPLMDEAEQRRLLVEWNGTAVKFTDGSRVHDLIARPTESTVDATSRVEGALSGLEAVANTRAYVLDTWMQPVPTGVPGELYLGGVGLAQAPPHQPHLTAERFVPDALSGVPGARLYRTGDRVRWKADGTLEALPRTPSRLLDREALPPTHASGGEVFRPPSTPVQQELAILWRNLLRVERVGMDDSFFTLGGHSLLATQLVSRIRATFKVELPLRAVFEAPTLAGLAQRITSLQGGGAPRHQAPPLQPVPRDRALPLSFAQQRLWFIDQLEPGSAAYNLPSAVRLSGALDIAALERALHALIERHESLRTTFAMQDGEAVQLIHAPAQAPLPLVDLSTLPDEKREAEAHRLATTEAAEPFDLARGPLLRATLLRLQDSEHVLLLTMHHIVSDGWSMSVLVRELGALYEAALSGEAPRLPPLPIQYADYSVWQRGWLRGEVLDAWLDYWKQQLAGAPPALELPTDRPRPPVQTSNGAAHSFTLPPELSEQLEALAHEHHATLFMVLLAGFQTLLHRYSGQDD